MHDLTIRGSTLAGGAESEIAVEDGRIASNEAATIVARFHQQGHTDRLVPGAAFLQQWERTHA